MSKHHIFLTGEAGYHNLGDEGMALATVHRLKRYFPDARLIATGLDPLGAVLRHQAHIVPWPILPDKIQPHYLHRIIRKYGHKLGFSDDFLDPMNRSFEKIFQNQYAINEQFRFILKEIQAADFVFDMGHGGLNDVFSPLMLCFLYYLSGRLEKPLFISGQSVGPLWRQSSLKMIKETLPLAHTVGLRDIGISKDILLTQVGLSETEVNMVEVGDDTLDLPTQEPDWTQLPQFLSSLIQSGKFISVQWRSSDYSQQLNETSQLIPLINLLKAAHEASGLPLLFVPLSWETHHNDIVVAAQISDYLEEETPFYVIWRFMNAQQIKWILGRAQFGIGLSYHFHVFSLSQGVPTIPIYTNHYYRIKLQGAMAAFGYTTSLVDYATIRENTDPYTEILENVMAWREEAKARLLASASHARSAWHDAFARFIQDNALV